MKHLTIQKQKIITTKITGMEMFREKKDEVNVGDNVAMEKGYRI